MSHPDDVRLAIVREEERGFAAAAHLMTMVPLWGVVFLACLWLYFRESSREVVFHVQQALVYHMVMLSAFCVWLLVDLALMPVQVLSPWLAAGAKEANFALLSIVLGVYGLGCLVGCVQTYRGQPFLYPVIGRRVLRGAARKSMMGD